MAAVQLPLAKYRIEPNLSGFNNSHPEILDQLGVDITNSVYLEV